MSSRSLLLSVTILCMVPNILVADDREIRLTPYVWFAGLEGDVATIPGTPSAPIDISPSEALEDTEASFMLIADVKRGKHGIFADFLYTDVQSGIELVPPPIGLTLRSISKTTVFSLAYQYEFYRQNEAVADLIIGARYWDIDSELNFGGGLGMLAGRRIMNDESWIDPAIGVKGRTPLKSSNFYFEYGAGVGGFGVGSELFYEFNGVIGYQWSSAIGTTIGYRMFDVDYEEGDFSYDVRQEGWQLGLTWAL